MQQGLLPILSAVVFATVMTPAANAQPALSDAAVSDATVNTTVNIPVSSNTASHNTGFDTFEKQGITIQIGTPSQGPHGHRYQYIHHPNGQTYRYNRYGYRPNRRIHRRIYRQHPHGHSPEAYLYRRIYRPYPGHRPGRRIYRYYRYDH
ncbi:MAG: hypothetical protein AAF152_03485 [Cyanobacteria bacterium P01_A01_bin.114]